MSERTEILKQLVRESQYVIDPAAVAEAIVVRSTALRLVPDLAFRSRPAAGSPTQVRSFRPHRRARSFRLADAR